jgi:hypothetical protein
LPGNARLNHAPRTDLTAVDHTDFAADRQHLLRFGDEGPDQAQQGVRFEHGIGIHDADQWIAGKVDGAINRVGFPAVFFVDDGEPGEARAGVNATEGFAGHTDGIDPRVKV